MCARVRMFACANVRACLHACVNLCVTEFLSEMRFAPLKLDNVPKSKEMINLSSLLQGINFHN